MTNRLIAPIISDSHGGHTGALMNPATVIELEDELGNRYNYQPEMTEIQKYLWNIYTEALGKIETLAGEDPLVALHTGDNVEGNRHPSELVRPELSAQIKIAFDNLIPLCRIKNLRALRIVKGTGAHELGFASATAILIQLLNLAYPDLDIQSTQHGWMNLGGINIDYSHHGPGRGRRKWLEGNEARYYLRDCMMNDIAEYGKPADVYIRGHVHVPIIEKLRVDGYWSTLVVVPSMKIGGEYGFQVTRSAPAIANGMVALEIEADKLRDVHEYIHVQDLRTREVISV
jgi:hypothetical protein